MGVGAGYIGRPLFKVSLSESPFNGVPNQEWSYYFTQENEGTLSNVSEIYSLPQPWNGIRCAEEMQNYDNFLSDTKTLLENAVDSSDGTLVSPEAAALVAGLKYKRSQTDSGDTTVFEEGDKFFTWNMSSGNFFEKSANNNPSSSFSSMNLASYTGPKWSYINKVKPDGSNSEIITPFMNALPNNPKQGIHWSACTADNWPISQPFEVTYYHEGFVQSIAQESPALNPRIKNIITQNDLSKVDISKRGYLAIQFGAGPTNSYLILLISGENPRIYTITGVGSNFTGNAKLLSVFDKVSGDTFFGPTGSTFSIKVEPVAFGMLITSNLFGDKQWIVNSLDGSQLMVGGSRIAIASGNVKAGFAIRPVQYAIGKFTTSGQPVFQTTDDDRVPVFTTAMKGTGQNQAATTSNPNDNSQEVNAVDAEYVNGQSVRSIIDASVAKASPGGRLNRRIDFVQNVSDFQEAANGRVKTTTYALDVTMTPSDVGAGSSFTIKNGRSPYLWQVRAQLDQQDNGGGGGSGGADISCAVQSCDLTWNATSFLEFAHNGTLRIQLRPDTGVVIPESYKDGALYLTIDAKWENGVGGGGFKKVFTGMSVGASVEKTVATDILVLQIEDYMAALDGVKFILSPYYDGMVAKNAVKDIVKRSGLPDSMILTGGGTISASADDPEDYGLPFVNPIEQPQFRFAMGSSLKAGILKIAELDLKTIFFDEAGNFHYDPIPGGIFNDQDTTPVIDFVSSPKDTDDPFAIVWNTVSSGRMINDVYNVITVGTVDKNTQQRITVGDQNSASIFEPGSPGYLGYRKHLIMNDPSIGSLPAANKYLSTYKNRVFIPPYSFKFETYGRGGLVPLQVVTVDGEKARIMNISMHGDAKEETWWMNVEAEWFDSVQ